ncbi:HD family phosphohydrolase [Candidatus Magnetomorum sp. HK-1]|nr:HD family phosphohydrolase [Candidatus Magnetomorum sp. HK-1]
MFWMNKLIANVGQLMDISYYQKWFDQYTDQYLNQDDEKDYPFILKKKHTRRVCKAICSICDDLVVSDETRYLAQIIALFHDLGRFEQYAKYGTFRDIDSVNHGIQSIRDLMRHNVLKNLTPKQKKIVCNAIRYHNVANVPLNKSPEILFFIHLIRDADKLDIWNIFIDYFSNKETQKNNVIELGVPDNPEITDDILQALFNGKIALISKVQTLNDFKLIQLSWIYDLNFRFSFEWVKKNQIIELLTQLLPKTIEIQQLTQKLIDYLDQRLNQS